LYPSIRSERKRQDAPCLEPACAGGCGADGFRQFFAGPGTRRASPEEPQAGSLPSLGETSELAAAAERRIGDRIAASIYRDPDYIDDPVLTDYLQSIWLPLVAAARTRGELHAELEERFAWQVFLIRDRSINAFALPGGYFGVHLGLIAAVGSRMKWPPCSATSSAM
jgi:predicted Zn-dependent protease